MCPARSGNGGWLAVSSERHCRTLAHPLAAPLDQTRAIGDLVVHDGSMAGREQDHGAAARLLRALRLFGRVVGVALLGLAIAQAVSGSGWGAFWLALIGAWLVLPRRRDPSLPAGPERWLHEGSKRLDRLERRNPPVTFACVFLFLALTTTLVFHYTGMPITDWPRDRTAPLGWGAAIGYSTAPAIAGTALAIWVGHPWAKDDEEDLAEYRERLHRLTEPRADPRPPV